MEEDEEKDEDAVKENILVPRPCVEPVVINAAINKYTLKSITIRQSLRHHPN